MVHMLRIAYTESDVTRLQFFELMFPPAIIITSLGRSVTEIRIRIGLERFRELHPRYPFRDPFNDDKIYNNS